MLKSTRQNDDLDHQGLSQMSTLARNQLVIEHVVGSRNMRDWKEKILEEIHAEQQNRKPPTDLPTSASSSTLMHKRTQSQAISRRE